MKPETQTITETATTLAHRHAKTMGLHLNEATGAFYLRDDRHLLTLVRNNLENRHLVTATRDGHVIHSQTYGDLDTAVLVVHGLARRHGIPDNA